MTHLSGVAPGHVYSQLQLEWHTQICDQFAKTLQLEAGAWYGSESALNKSNSVTDPDLGNGVNIQIPDRRMEVVC